VSRTAALDAGRSYGIPRSGRYPSPKGMLRNVTLCARFRPTTPGGGYLSKSYAPSVLLRNPALEAFCCTYGGPDMAARTHVDRIPRDPGPIAYAALDSDSRATGYYAPRSVKDAD
jgi:hypothetical protein